jgi:hypothetical protein
MTRLGFWLAADAAYTLGALKLDSRSIEALARRRLSRLLFDAALSSEFYQRRLQRAGIEWADHRLWTDPYGVLAALPPVTKHELRQAGPSVLSGGEVRSSWLSSASSGSTGEPFRVYYNLGRGRRSSIWSSCAAVSPVESDRWIELPSWMPFRLRPKRPRFSREPCAASGSVCSSPPRR